VSHGHAHPRIVRALVEQAQRLAVTSRVFHNELLPAFLQRLTVRTGLDRALPANGGAESVETALKAARKWGTQDQGHSGRSRRDHRLRQQFPRALDRDRRLLVGAAVSRRLRAVRAGIPSRSVRRRRRTRSRDRTPHRGVPRRADTRRGWNRRPAAGYLAQCARICRERNVLLICDEIQTGMGRTGKFLACEHDDVKPDGVILGKALGGGLLPVSAFVATEDVMQVFTPGDHGSTFGGNPLAAAVVLPRSTCCSKRG
jgi:ornithine--oxo-acid transaminase